MNELELIIDFHADGNRQGPGSTEDTLLALRLIEEDRGKQDSPLNIADTGCGTGSHTLILAHNNFLTPSLRQSTYSQNFSISSIPKPSFRV